ncbi:trypsin-like peptidase domain-containing protein [Nocardioides humilatus]|uniref:Trypsin-like peptidase domain-containing protein n=1 Tax=Nocardioides humilatus TaxID=2607660 RepID=A0A5B1LBQ3_9ACTN|nr:trypsin-like peptidase domain-containing protein [Nocardioides humilatus]KAA1417678.1 trypsin-like peptidase domain-containing protein [Nocardioides humilatus]
MSAEREGDPWGTVLVLLTILAIANWWFAPFERDDPDAEFSSAEREPMVRKSRGWTPAPRAQITPGIQTITEGAGQCTTNFVFTDARDNVYLGQAAHCAEVAEGTNDCRTRTRPLGTRVVFTTGATSFDLGDPIAEGRLAYSSWRTMRERGVKKGALCSYNDFALVRVPRSARDLVNPSIPFWGGPTGLTRTGLSAGEHVYGFGRSSLREEGSTYSRQAAVAFSDRDTSRGWSHTISSRSPGLPGDSGSAYVDEQGNAVGTLSTLSFGVLFVWNGLGDLPRELAYARKHSGIKGLRLEVGTVPFREARAYAWSSGKRDASS